MIAFFQVALISIIPFHFPFLSFGLCCNEQRRTRGIFGWSCDEGKHIRGELSRVVLAVAHRALVRSTTDLIAVFYSRMPLSRLEFRWRSKSLSCRYTIAPSPSSRESLGLACKLWGFKENENLNSHYFGFAMVQLFNMTQRHRDQRDFGYVVFLP
jgi:hypothetical protein